MINKLYSNLNSFLTLILTYSNLLFRRYGNPRAPSEIIDHLVPLGPKTKSTTRKAATRKYQPSGFRSEAHTYRSIFEEQNIIHPPVTDSVIHKQHNIVWYQVQEKKRLPYLDIYRKFKNT